MARIESPRKTGSRTPWSYREGNTPLHRCPCGIKLLLLLLFSASPFFGFSAVPFLWFSVMGGAAVLILAGAISARLSPKELLAGSRPLLIMLLVFTTFRAAGLDAASPLRLDLVFVTVSLDADGLLNGLRFAAGILVCFAAASLFFAVTTTMELRQSLFRIELFFRYPFQKKSSGKQGGLSLALALMLGFLPRFFEHWENATLAARARGCGSLRRIMVILPLVTERLIEAAAETAEALESRGLEL